MEDELAWLNGVALDHLKNYQIWHHRQLLLDHIYPKVESEGPAALARLRRSEGDFLVKMLAEDAKNYHVWSYRQHLVRRLSMWPSVHPAELAAVQALIDEDVRNNSAWSHRFFLVFSDPAVATPGSHSTERDPKIPESVIDREIAYATDKIRLAPQNQSPWNYLRGVLAKGGRGFSAVKQLAESFVSGLGGGDEAEQVLSSHALEFLAEAAAEAGDKDAAALALDRLAERWDRIRAGYWRWRKKVVLGEADSHVVGGSDDENKKMELPLREGPQVQAA